MPTPDREALLRRYANARAFTDALCAPLSPEDQMVQSMPDASPTKWHRAHTTWFFETFVLAAADQNRRPVDETFSYLFNSYYDAVGARHPRHQRGLLTRPSSYEVGDYRAGIDRDIAELLATGSAATIAEISGRIELGIHHEQQHQELLLMDIKHAFSCNQFDPVYARAQTGRTGQAAEATGTKPTTWVDVPGGQCNIGANVGGFSFDNEGPPHRVLLEPFRLADRPVTAGEWLEFMADDGYCRPELWLADGWAAVVAHKWNAPLYWRHDGDTWSLLTLHGRRTVDPDEPVVHISQYEADAFARWSRARLPTEFEWEHAQTSLPTAAPGVLLTESDPERQELHPRGTGTQDGLRQMLGDVWEWTSSAYLPYPRFQPARGALGEYNGKFMSSQMVLRGGSCVTAASHIRGTYRNFFPPGARWVFGGVRLARDS